MKEKIYPVEIAAALAIAARYVDVAAEKAVSGGDHLFARKIKSISARLTSTAKFILADLQVKGGAQ